MKFITAQHTDIGIKKKTNQDSLLIEQAHTKKGDVLLAVICDGLGGLAKGEAASACAAKAFSEWFRNEFPDILYSGMSPEALCDSWENLAKELNMRIIEYGNNCHLELGTTCVALLIVENTYYIMNIGDSRAYLISDNVYQLTKDQTWVQNEIDAGRLTEEEALVSPQRSVLLQCIGVNGDVFPDFFTGEVKKDQCFMLCCDGFRHVITLDEFYNYLGAFANKDENAMKDNLVYLTELNKQRNETDNITAILVKTI